MWRKPFHIIAIVAITLLSSSLSLAQEQRGNWEITFGALGTNNNDFDQVAFGGSAQLGYFVTDWLELGLRQTISYVKVPDSSATDASTAFALDLNFPLGKDGRIVPFVGGNVGFFYGDTVTDSFEYGPEAGIKYFVNSTTFLYGRVEWQFFEDNITGGGGTTSNSSDQQVVYQIGIGFRF
jgi:hypothetical protein